MPKRTTTTFTSEDQDAVEDTLWVYFCRFTGEHCLITGASTCPTQRLSASRPRDMSARAVRSCCSAPRWLLDGFADLVTVGRLLPFPHNRRPVERAATAAYRRGVHHRHAEPAGAAPVRRPAAEAAEKRGGPLREAVQVPHQSRVAIRVPHRAGGEVPVRAAGRPDGA